MIKTSIARKVAMALSGLFLILFLGQHFTINITSVFSEKTFNMLSHFMGNNPLVQFVLQPILIFGVVFHFVMGFVLDIKNRKSRSEKYISFKGSANASWVSRNMIFSGIVVLSFLGLHLFHGFSSSFQSVGFNNKYTTGIRWLTVSFSIVIPIGFIFIAMFHHLNG